MTSVMKPFFSAMLIGDSPDPTAKVGFKVVRELSKADHDRYRTDYQLVERLLHTSIAAYVNQTLKDFIRVIEQDVEELKSGQVNFTQPDDVVRMGIRMRGAVLTLCSALHMHQEHINGEVVERFGENSSVHKKVRKIFTRLYDKSQAYRILWHTRNTMVHHTLETISISATAFLDSNNERQAVTMPRVDLSAIIELNDRISDSFRAELVDLGENPYVLELINEAIPLVSEANKRINTHLYPQLDAACATIREFDSIFAGLDGVRALTSERTTNDPPPLKFSYSTWSGDVIMFARERLASA
ncbi:hypothetical protein OG579_01540 [Williamsia herbipolensis]|uniref:Cthe-2314-like HEPN domain-containing protein n=1 Tax=Williamsia herbipolensis TaxID=1603258 RepID=A0AAU4K3J7_9NOCA|nr:hypothetical protein [Williamsia herbipolensis]